MPKAFSQPFKAATLFTAFTRPMILLRTSFASGHDGRICSDPEEISTPLTKKNKKKEIKKKKKEQNSTTKETRRRREEEEGDAKKKKETRRRRKASR